MNFWEHSSQASEKYLRILETMLQAENLEIRAENPQSLAQILRAVLRAAYRKGSPVGALYGIVKFTPVEGAVRISKRKREMVVDEITIPVLKDAQSAAELASQMATGRLNKISARVNLVSIEQLAQIFPSPLCEISTDEGEMALVVRRANIDWTKLL